MSGPDPVPELAPTGPLGVSWCGATKGYRWVSYVAGPLASLLLLPGLALLAFGGGAGRGWAIPSLVLRAFGFYLVFSLLGTFLGALIGLAVGLTGRTRSDSPFSRALAAAGRPIRLSPSRGGATGSPVVASRPPRRLWPWLVGSLAVSSIASLAIGYAAGVHTGGIVDRRLEEAIAAADQDDPDWRLGDFMDSREQVPDEENSAHLVAEALSLMPGDWPGNPGPESGAATLPARVAKAYERLGETPENLRLDGGTSATLRAELERHRDAVRVARTVADYRRGRHEIELGPTLIDTPLPETQAARPVARLLAADVAVRAEEGDVDGALDSCRAILGVARSIGDEPFLISQLVRMAIRSVAISSTRRVLAQGEPSDQAMIRLQDLLIDELAQPILLHGLRGERAVLTDLIQEVGMGEIPISALSNNSPGIGSSVPNPSSGPWGELWFDNQFAVGLTWMNELVAIARGPAAERPPRLKAWQARLDRVKSNRLEALATVLPLLLIPAQESAFSADSRVQCELGTTVILLAAERQRRKSGAWPAAVNAIDRDILPSPPNDPFSGHSFIMEHRDGRLVIYSIGPDLKDEHGAYDPKRWLKGGPDDVGTSGWDQNRRRLPPRP